MLSPRSLLVLLVSSFFTNQNNLAGVEFLVRETEFENSLGELISKYSKLTQVITPWVFIHERIVVRSHFPYETQGLSHREVCT